MTLAVKKSVFQPKTNTKFRSQYVIKTIQIVFIRSRSLHKYLGKESDIQVCHKVCYRMAELFITEVNGLCQQYIDSIMQKAYSRAINEGKAFTEQLEVYTADIQQVQRSSLPKKNLGQIKSPSLVKEVKKITLKYQSN